MSMSAHRMIPSPGSPPPPRRRLLSLALLGASLLGGCAIYHPRPLHPAPAARSLAQLKVSADTMPLPALRTHAFDPSNGLDVTETAMLAVANNPTLKVMRDQLGVSRAQAFDAGLLPDPVLAASRDVPSSKGPGLTSAYNLGLNFDLGSLLTRSARVAAARASQHQVHLELLWAEWQTIAQARLLFDQVQTLRTQEMRLRHERQALGTVDATIDRALKDGNIDYASASVGLNATANVRNLLDATILQRTQAEHDLRALLGLAPSVQLHLVGPSWQPQPDAAALARAEKSLVQRRPDLLALKAGYAAQEARVRAAILAQYPAIQIGFNHARDTSNIHTNGLSIGLTLPLFNANRGKIAIARATRQELADAYRARLLGTRNDMHRLLAQLHTLDSQLHSARQHASQLDAAGKRASASWQRGLLDWPTWLSIRTSALDADLTVYALQQQRDVASIALETLLGGDWSDHATPSHAPSRMAEQSP